jgi:hypothetical protein
MPQRHVSVQSASRKCAATNLVAASAAVNKLRSDTAQEIRSKNYQHYSNGKFQPLCHSLGKFRPSRKHDSAKKKESRSMAHPPGNALAQCMVSRSEVLYRQTGDGRHVVGFHGMSDTHEKSH